MDTVLLTILLLATCVWVGGYVAIIVVARAATATLDPAARVAFFRSLGRSYFLVGTPALVVALVVGAVLLRDVERDGTVVAAYVVAAVLVLAFAVAVRQARRMTVLRRDLIASPADANLTERVRAGARSAGLLRALLGVLSIALVVLGAVIGRSAA